MQKRTEDFKNKLSSFQSKFRKTPGLAEFEIQTFSSPQPLQMVKDFQSKKQPQQEQKKKIHISIRKTWNKDETKNVTSET